MPLPTPDEILQADPKERRVLVQPWVAAQLSDVWQTLRKNIEAFTEQMGTQGRVRTSQVMPASAPHPT